MLEFFHSRINIFIGHYGVGKTTLAVNLARQIRNCSDEHIYLADIDVNNPYFRSRDYYEKLAKKGIELIMPDPEIAFAEMPYVPKQIYAALQKEGKLFIDVGGNDMGTTVLGSLAEHLKNQDYQLWFVVNTFRPGAETSPEIEELLLHLQSLSKLKVNGIINNSNLAQYTTPEHVIESEQIVGNVASRLAIEEFVNCADESLVENLGDRLTAPTITVQRLEKMKW